MYPYMKFHFHVPELSGVLFRLPCLVELTRGKTSEIKMLMKCLVLRILFS